jgi:Polyketide cyclase / dehydrase and lipid transport
MKPITVHVTIDRPRPEVFAHLDVLANHEPFTNHFLTDWELEGPERGVGARVRMTAHAFGRSERVELEVVDAVDNESIVERTYGAGGKRVTRGTYRLADADAGTARTAVTFELAAEQVPPAERLAWPLARGWLRRQNARAMERLKEQLEGAPVGA